MKRRERNTFRLMLLPLYVFTLVFILAPLLYLLILSFGTRGKFWGVLPEFTLQNYREILNPVYLRTFWESLKLACISTFLIALIGYPYGYFMARLPAKQKKYMMLLLLIPFFTSSLVRLYGWIILFRANGPLDRLLLWTKVTEKPLYLLYTYPAVVTGMVYSLLPFMIFTVYSSAEKIDWGLLEAARDLGASPVQAFFTVTWKLTLPGLLAGVILTFIPSMGMFYLADLLGGNQVVLVGSIIQEQLLKTHNWPFAAALSVVLMALTTVLLSLYRRVIRGQPGEGIL